MSATKKTATSRNAFAAAVEKGETTRKPDGLRTSGSGAYVTGKFPTKKITVEVPLDVRDLINDVVGEAAAEGNRITKNQVVTDAIRAHYGKKPRKR